MAWRSSVALGLSVALAAAGCDGTLDAGRDMPHQLIPDAAPDTPDQPLLDASPEIADQLLLETGQDAPHGLLPIDERNPVIVMNDDWSGDWLGEYAVLLANTGGPPLAGIIVKASSIGGI
jgi:hypothetical protein